MFGMKATTEANTEAVKKAADRATYRNIRHAAFSIRKAAVASIVKSNTASAPGTPPATRGRGGKNIRGAIFVDADNESALIGPRASVIGEAGEAHEFGGEFRGADYPERAFMGPALEANRDRFASEWVGSIGE